MKSKVRTDKPFLHKIIVVFSDIANCRLYL